MAGTQASYVILDVFAEQRLKGNPLAVVDVSSLSLTQERKQQIAREFNLSETVFLHSGGPDQNPRAEIFTPVNEMEFAGHPVIGTGHLLFRKLSGQSRTQTLETRAGPVQIEFDPDSQIVSAQVPHNIHVHATEAPLVALKAVQPCLGAASGLAATSWPVVSIVKGVTYVLADLTENADVFGKLGAGESPRIDLDEGWGPSFVGTMYYRNMGSRVESDTMIWDLRVRMIAINLEDPACGSGSSSLAAYLALQKGGECRKHRFLIDQGSEIGRDSHIVVDIELAEDGGRVSSVKLAGPAAFVAEGKVYVD
ncbi:phenazine biosynthesis-like protein [Aspergillus steynii IBT 23096]|uniref:Phenazine biosynthesis-like protein n=1 Tax=Aspergillus steynii IBT 23096 TaxID=1392250 RepID=A0A2I2GP02_9EURO|nr:phenazine biosynthesis-like protein [Aspergillus steynii IBT 23096]PLB54606.1 phenazine biosynthesis-like protein [Aspergillus steynii IBT 23096]